MINFLAQDYGIFTEHCNALADNGKNKVRYFTPFNYQYSEYCKGKDYGFLEKILYFFDHIKWADSIVNFDVRGQDAIAFLRSQFPEKSIFGSGDAGKLEDDRVMLKEFSKSLGVPIGPYVICEGISKLREYLKAHKEIFVKINIFREEMESFYAKDYASIEQKLDQIADHLGPHKEIMAFICEDAIDAPCEVGADLFFSGGQFLKPYLYGVEYKKNLYFGKISNELQKCLEKTLFPFSKLFTKLDYRGAVSHEAKCMSESEGYLLDLCARMASPFTALYTEEIENWPEIVYAIGKGEHPEIKFRHPYVGAFTLKSQEALHVYEKVNIKDKSKVKMFTPVGNKKGDYGVIGEDHLAVVIAGGGSLEEILDLLKKNAEEVDSCDMDKDPLKGIEGMQEIIEECEKNGIKF